MDKLICSLIQTDLHWENAVKNRHLLESKINSITGETDLIVLPEMFSTGFSMRPKDLFETMEGPTVLWMKKLASKYRTILSGSIIIKDNESYFNRMLWVEPGGNIEFYDKRHLFRLVGEEKHYQAGQSRQIVQLNGFNINLNICYDLRFPVWSRNRNDYDIIINVANWPERRSNIWKTLLRARAIENQCYVIGVNRVGNDGNDIYHSGDSAIIHPSGETLISSKNEDSIVTYTLSKPELESYRRKYPFYRDADNFKVL